MSGCNHIVGLSGQTDKLFTKQSDEQFPSEMFIYCPVCGEKITWDYLTRKILFS